MKTLLVSSLFLTAFSARADDGFKHSVQIRNLSDSVTAKLVVNTDNPELGRAWIEIADEYQDPLTSDAKMSAIDYSNLKVPGLTYNQASKEITYKKSTGESIVCATSVRHSFFSGLKLNLTGKCPLTIHKERVMKDDGFALHPAALVIVSLNP